MDRPERLQTTQMTPAPWTRPFPACAQPLVVVSLLLSLGACSTVDQIAADVLAARAPAVGLYAERVLQGEVSFTSPRVGTMHLQTSQSPVLSCVGQIAYTGSATGVVHLSCNDGALLVVPFQALGPLRGVGRSQPGGKVMSLTYGMAPDMVASYLGVPVELVRPPPQP